jgi:hypothetical protein
VFARRGRGRSCGAGEERGRIGLDFGGATGGLRVEVYRMGLEKPVGEGMDMRTGAVEFEIFLKVGVA